MTRTCRRNLQDVRVDAESSDGAIEAAGDDAIDAIEVTDAITADPSVSATAHVTKGPAPLQLNLDCMVLEGTGTPPFTYRWTLGDARSDIRNPTHTFDDVGEQTATCTVTDSVDRVAKGSVAITVLDASQLPEVSGVIAGYRADYPSDASIAPNWRYLWNAPDGWTRGSTGDMATGAIGDPSCYVALEHTETSWTADADADGKNGTPARFLSLGPTAAHPGLAAGFVYNGMTNEHDRYAIAAFTAPVSGVYALVNSTLRKKGPQGDPVDVVVYVNEQFILSAMAELGGPAISFDRKLGDLLVGDTLYVAVGPHGDPDGDSAALDFSVRLTAPLGVPRLELPVDKTSTSMLRPTLRWFAVKTAESYQVQIAPSSEFANVASAAKTDGNSHVLKPGLNAGTYFWRVRAVNAADLAGDWSAVFELTIGAGG